MAWAEDRRERIGGAALAVAVQALVVWALLAGLAVRLPAPAEEALKLFAPVPERRIEPRPRPTPPPRRNRRPSGAAAPAGLKARATPLVAPSPLVVLPPPLPVVTAPLPGTGAADHAGNAAVPGPGPGAGGAGTGTGSGFGGDGDGGGYDETPPRWRKGRIRDSDFPREADEAAMSGTVDVRYSVEPSGRVGRCAVTRSSGHKVLDDTTCRLIVERFRFDPARDDRGAPVRSWIVESHEWNFERLPPEPAAAPRRRVRLFP
jgi:periplasmic protein TonB